MAISLAGHRGPTSAFTPTPSSSRWNRVWLREPIVISIVTARDGGSRLAQAGNGPQDCPAGAPRATKKRLYAQGSSQQEAPLKLPAAQFSFLRVSRPLLLCLSFIAALAALQARPATSQTSSGDNASVELAALRTEVARIKGLAPSQSHAMQDVSYHYTNLWFAGQKGNWPLAEFYLAETRSHLRWAVRIIPKRKVSTGEVDLDGIRAAFDDAYLSGVEQAIKAKSTGRFSETYKFSLEGCYACHKASEKPYLRLQVPTRPETQIVNFDPNAKWPN